MKITVKKEVEELIELELPVFYKSSEIKHPSYYAILTPNKMLSIHEGEGYATVQLSTIVSPSDLSKAADERNRIEDDVFYLHLSRITEKIKELAQTEIAA